MKRLFCGILCAVLLFAALPGSVNAQSKADRAKKEQVVKSVSESYTKSLEWSGKESLTGYCGTMTSYQLWYLGINEWAVVHDGNKQFDYYRDMEKTTGGYYVKAYPASEFSLETVLNLITRDGTQDAYNIMVGFESTITEAGSVYGHCCVINAILDGMVYYAESSPTPMGGAEGNVIICTIQEFADYYNSWTTFEGVIYFGTGDYSDSCQKYGTDLFVRTRFASNLRSQPCLIGESDCVSLRSISPGELLHVDSIVKDPRGTAYYRVRDGEQIGYIAAGAVSVVRYNGEDAASENIQIPAQIEPGADPELSGNVIVREGLLGAVEIVVKDMQEQTVLEARQLANGVTWDIAGLNERLHLELLEEGAYYVEVYGEAACRWARGYAIETNYIKTLVYRQLLKVGKSVHVEKPVQARTDKTLDGWFWKAGKWYCYQNGQPVTGWKLELGVAYYLDETGTVATGWTEVEGKQRLFSATGALLKGWLVTDAGKMYLQADGSASVGLTQIGQELYCFGEDGILKLGGTVTEGEATYDISPDGTAVLQAKQ